MSDYYFWSIYWESCSNLTVLNDFRNRTRVRQIRERKESWSPLDVTPVKDDYCIKVRLKDDSVYAYAPRRFAHSERLQMRKITDDLLQRGIIRPSISPYCARVVLLPRCYAFIVQQPKRSCTQTPAVWASARFCFRNKQTYHGPRLRISVRPLTTRPGTRMSHVDALQS